MCSNYFKVSYSKHFESLIINREAPVYFHNFWSKFESPTHAKLVLFKNFQKTPQKPGGSLQNGHIVSYLKQLRGGSLGTARHLLLAALVTEVTSWSCPKRATTTPFLSLSPFPRPLLSFPWELTEP
jgi:hypothetical protein